MGMTSNHSSTFGGSFKEAIVLACLSSRRYAFAKSMPSDLRMGKLKVNMTLLWELSGLNDEDVVFRCLSSF